MQRLTCGARRFHRRGRNCGRSRGVGGFFGGEGGLGEGAEVLAREFGVLDINRTRVGLFLGDADLGKELDQDFGLDLEFAGQLVDADLVRL